MDTGMDTGMGAGAGAVIGTGVFQRTGPGLGVAVRRGDAKRAPWQAN